jgi:hypothetical protein
MAPTTTTTIEIVNNIKKGDPSPIDFELVNNSNDDDVIKPPPPENLMDDPFDADWVSLALKQNNNHHL